MARHQKKWLYKKNGRYYADFRSYADVGGGQEALIQEGERFATKQHPSRSGSARSGWRSFPSCFAARAVEILPQGHRPSEGLMNRPEVEDEEAQWLDGPTATLLLQAARLYEPKRPDVAVACAYTIIAALVPTGMRPAEGLGLLIEDIDFDRKRISVRRNQYRRLKTRRSRRVVPLWPQLEGILRDYLERMGNATSGILFPSPRRPARPVGSIKRLVKELAACIGYEGGLTPKAFRHTYCAARLQTTDRGEPVALLTVARELGHKNTKMVEEIYGHVGPGLSSFKRKP